MAEASQYLICYDIADPKRLGRLHRYVSAYGIMVQYSVYLARLTPAELEVLTSGIRRRINPHADDVRIYTLPEKVEVEVLRREDKSVWSFGMGGADKLVDL